MPSSDEMSVNSRHSFFILTIIQRCPSKPDPDANLASAVGITREELKGVKPLAQMRELIAGGNLETPERIEGTLRRLAEELGL